MRLFLPPIATCACALTTGFFIGANYSLSFFPGDNVTLPTQKIGAIHLDEQILVSSEPGYEKKPSSVKLKAEEKREEEQEILSVAKEGGEMHIKETEQNNLSLSKIPWIEEKSTVPSFFQADPTPDLFLSASLQSTLHFLPITSLSQKYIQCFVSPSMERRRFQDWLEQSGPYYLQVIQILNQLGVPAELAAIAFVQSSFSPLAVSPEGKSGLWQLDAEFASQHALKIEQDYDERRNIHKSTKAVGEYFFSLYRTYGSWKKACTAYFKKEEGEGILVERTAAIAFLLKNLEHFGFRTSLLNPPFRLRELQVPCGTSLNLVARAAGLSVSNLKLLNPELNYNWTPHGEGKWNIYVPSEGVGRARVMLPRLLKNASWKGKKDFKKENQVSVFFDQKNRFFLSISDNPSIYLLHAKAIPDRYFSSTSASDPAILFS